MVASAARPSRTGTSSRAEAVSSSNSSPAVRTLRRAILARWRACRVRFRNKTHLEDARTSRARSSRPLADKLRTRQSIVGPLKLKMMLPPRYGFLRSVCLRSNMASPALVLFCQSMLEGLATEGRSMSNINPKPLPRPLSRGACWNQEILQLALKQRLASEQTRCGSF